MTSMRLRLFSVLLALPFASSMAGELGGSRASLRNQNEIAKEHDFTFLRTAAQVEEFVEKDRLVEVLSDEDILVNNVSFPYTRPIVYTFIQRLAAQFRAATGHRLVVTSLTRPTSLQPRNASPLSVHPAGMAVDLRVPASSSERSWLERTLLSLEDRGLLDVTREKSPPHYHVAVFPDAYAAHVDKLIAGDIVMRAVAALNATRHAAANVDIAPPSARYTVPATLGIAVAAVVLVPLAFAGTRARARRS